MKTLPYIIILLLLVYIGLLALKPNEVLFVQEEDFPNDEEGSLVFNVRLDTKIQADYITFFASQKIPGLAIRYHIPSSNLLAGLPTLQSHVNLFDSAEHAVAYTFSKNGEQILYIDGNEVAKSSYNPAYHARITGLAITEPVVHHQPHQLTVMSKQLSRSYIREMMKSYNQ